MRYRTLGDSDLNVSELCLGTMTWGQQNTEAEGFEQMDYAVEQGINFFDTAEMYSVPTQAATYGSTETIIGNWLAARGKRKDIILATKICGPGAWLPHIRNAETRFNKHHIEQALHGSLKRLKTDYIDLYQLHWPDRNTNFFGKLGYRHSSKELITPVEETLQALAEYCQQGKIRYIGLSNETPWGVMEFVRLAKQMNLPKVISVQNPYSLLNRSFEIGLAEVAHRENVPLLAYSPLAFGMLSGKYMQGNWPENARLTLFKQFSRYTNDEAFVATEMYLNLAREQGLSPVQMALAYVNSRSFLGANIIGATSMDQLKENIGSVDITLEKPVLEAIEKIHTKQPNPAP